MITGSSRATSLDRATIKSQVPFDRDGSRRSSSLLCLGNSLQRFPREFLFVPNRRRTIRAKKRDVNSGSYRTT